MLYTLVIKKKVGYFQQFFQIITCASDNLIIIDTDTITYFTFIDNT